VIDRIFGNRYRLVEKIGIGGMAEVYKATDEVLGRTVAVKVMLPQYASDPTFAARFKREAQSAANLQSPYIVNIYDWGHDEMDNTYFIVMEYVRGTDLKTAIQQRGAINQRKAAEIASQVCAALSVAHSYDIIHRDIKPHNIMVQPDGNAKVMDFGIARANGSTMTQTGSVLGTAYYVSPEQAQGKPLTPATDLYSLGIVLYEAITGQVPFDAPDAVAVALKQVNEQPVPPTKFNPDIDPELEAIIFRAMEKNPLDRYATAEQMRTALNNYLAGRPIDTGVEKPAATTRVMGAASALPVISADGAQPPLHTAVMPSVANSQPPLSLHSTARAKEEKARKNKKRAIIIAVIAAVLCIAVIGVVVYNFMPKETEKVAVPDVVAKTEQAARDELTSAGLKAGKVSYEANESVEQGSVISTNPPARTQVEKDSSVDLVVSSGPKPPEKVKVPQLYDMTEADARSALEALELRYYRGSDRFDANVDEGKVCGQDLEAGDEVDKGQTVTFYLSKGKETGVVPNVVGATDSQANQYLTNAGFAVAYTDAEYSDSVAEGVVIRQDPPSGTTADTDATVTITLSLGPPAIIVPDLTGNTREEATTALQSLGLLIKFEEQPTDQVAQLDKVITQDPAPGTPLPKGGTVTVFIGLRVNYGRGAGAFRLSTQAV
jgi:serine/threonine-protein kinase